MVDDKKPISSQPQATPQIAVYVLQATAQMAGDGNRNVNNRQIGADGKREWSFGLFDCFARCSLCCWATWCPCVFYSKNKQRLRNLHQQGVPLPDGGERCHCQCFIYAALMPGYAWILHAITRGEIRERYAIRGAVFADGLIAWLCHPCSLTQERREIELEEGSFARTWVLTAEPVLEPPELLRKEREKVGLGADDFLVPGLGETVFF